MSFTTRIESYTNSTAGLDVTGALNKGIDYTIGVTANLNPDMLRLFAYKISLGTHSGVELDFMETYNLSHLIDVQRGLKFCRPVTDRQLSDIVDPTSIYYVLSDDPVYFLDGGGKLTIKPATVDADATRGYLFAVPHSGGRTVDDSNELIRVGSWSHNGISKVTGSTDDSSFPDVLYELVVMHASECILMERLVDFRASIPAGLDAEWANALAKTKLLFDDGANIEGDNAGASMSVQYWLADEDEDMTSTTLAAISSEMGRANAYTTKFKTDLEVVSVDYQWTSAQLQMLAQKKQEHIQTHLKLGPQGNPEGESKV